MRISEYQVHQLLTILGALCAPNAILTEEGRTNAQLLISEISNQQSTEIKEISDE